MSTIRVPETFPLAGSGPEGRKWTYELLEFAGDSDAIAKGWRKLEQGANYIRGTHKRHWPAMNIGRVLYSGAAHPLSSFTRIQLGPDALYMKFALWMMTVVADYDFSIVESAGANSITVTLPGSPTAHNIIVTALLDLSGAGVGMTNLSVLGDALAANHPSLKTIGWTVAEERSY